MKKKLKKDLWELAMLYRFDLGGYQYKKEYVQMVELAYKYDIKQLKELEQKNNKERKKINVELNKHAGKKWSLKLNEIMVKMGENAEESLNIYYAQDLLKIHEEKYYYYRK